MMRKEWKEGSEHKTLVFEINPFQGARDISDLPDSLLNIDNRWLTLT